MNEDLLNAGIIFLALLGLIVPNALAVLWQMRREVEKKVAYHDRVEPAQGPHSIIWMRPGWQVVDSRGRLAGKRKVDWFLGFQDNP